MSDIVKAYKAFDADLTCRGFQYAEGETYETDHAQLCQTGFHACEQPIHVLRYYRPATSVFHEVALEDVSSERHSDDSKVAARKITIGAKLSLAGLIEAQVKYVTERAKPVKGSTTASGYSGAATASGDSGAATASGDSGAATASGYSGAATASGDSGAATASGDSGAATASGDYGAATASGDSGAATASGRYGAATASGDSGAATASGYKSVAVVTGKDGRASGALGAWLVLTERDDQWEILDIASVKVGSRKHGIRIQPDTFYKLVGGRVVSA